MEVISDNLSVRAGVFGQLRDSALHAIGVGCLVPRNDCLPSSSCGIRVPGKPSDAVSVFVV